MRSMQPVRGLPPSAPESVALARRLWRILDVFVLAMLVFTLWRTPTVAAFAWGTAFAAAYLWGTVAGRRMLTVRGSLSSLPSRTPDRDTHLRIHLWLLLVIGLWIGLSFAAPDAAYLSFPLFFVAMHVASGGTGFLAVVTMTAVAVIALATHHGWTTGGVLGPVIGGAVALATGYGVHLLLVESHARARALRELKAARADIADISRRAGEEAERNRLAADIHDTVAQGLSSVQLLLHAAEQNLRGVPGTDDALTRIRLARDTAGHNLAETRRILRELQPAPLSDSGLPVALARICTLGGPDTPVGFPVAGDPRPLAEETEETIVRVAQSLVGNVVKHSAAGSGTVILTYHRDSTSLTVRDDGAGFDPAADTDDNSMGLAIAHRRAADVGGRLTVDSSPGNGCRVTLDMPDRMPDGA